MTSHKYCLQRGLAAAIALLALVAAAPRGFAADSDAQQMEFFEKRIRPILVRHCFECHADEVSESELRLDSLSGMLTGGTRGPALVPGQPRKSLLISAVNHGELLKMPPKNKLPTRVIADLSAWVKSGAMWPHSQAIVTPRKETRSTADFTRQEQAFWAFQSPKPPKLPSVEDPNWIKSPIDAFILSRLQVAGIKPAAPADKRTLIRRATFDLIGLPPTPEEVDAFLTDEAAGAFARVIDRLLASPHYGERWGRHWLDVARYADSNGLDENLAYANAYHYRDYVVSVFNHDKPYDQFVREQLAGDLLTNDDRATRSERIAATGFLLLGAKMLAEDDPLKMQMDIIDEQLDTIGRAFMGLTLGCARCHDHKFDPIRTSDYYALAGILKSTTTMEDFDVVARWQERPLGTPQQIQHQQDHQVRIDKLRQQIERVNQQASKDLVERARRHAGQYLLAATRAWQLDTWRAQTRPLGNDPDALQRPGLRIIEAEHYARGNLRKDTSQYGQSIGVLVNQGQLPNFVEYDVPIEAAGLYRLELRYAAASSRPCNLSVNGKLLRTDVAGQVTGSWFPDSQTWFVEDCLRLQPGENTIRLEQAKFFPHIDKLLLSPLRSKPRRQEIVRAVGSLINDVDSPGDAVADAEHVYQPIPTIVQQWVEYLKRTKDDPQSVLSDWHVVLVQADRLEDANVFALPSDSLNQLAHDYQQRFDAADRTAQPNATTEVTQRQSASTRQTLRRLLYAADGPFAVPANVERFYPPETLTQLKLQRTALKTLQQTLPRLPMVMAVSEGTIDDLRIHIRGNHLTQAERVPRGFPRILAGDQHSPLDAAESGRLPLAHWLTRPDHPLTSRVMVNRIWQGHFGEGLVRTPDNFGRLGQRPTHPQLLDWLATRFVHSGWSVKALHRTIMLSSTYQMSTQYNAAAAAADPENQLRWRMSRRRLQAEAIRDSILAVCGSLELTMKGTLLPTENRKYVTSTANVDPVVYVTNRRSIYLPVVRSALYEVFQAFDFADPSVSNGKRSSTTIAPQALFMMNSDLVARQAEALAKWLLSQSNLDEAGRLEVLYRRALGRSPTEAERDRCSRYVEQYSTALTQGTDRHVRAWQSLCRTILASNEFLYVE